jgi:arylsulfatase A-like enzyme
MVMYDTLNRRFLEPYGCTWTKTPNFTRLAYKAMKFNDFYVGSMPCMPARREIHTGRYNFMHRSWGPIEPFDDSMPEILRKAGIYTHLTTDHYHYIQDGGATYHNRYSSFEVNRGQEGDLWKGKVRREALDNVNDTYFNKSKGQQEQVRQDNINREYMSNDDLMPQTQTFREGLEFIDKNHGDDNWFLTIETFDPHEPFMSEDRFRKMYPDSYKGKLLDWPNYSDVTESDEEVKHLRDMYSALVSMCDEKLGTVLDAFDRYDLWKDTMLIVNTDHGCMLSEHNWWAKMTPYYNEIANTPFFLYDPRSPGAKEVNGLCQTIDIAPTLLDYFGVQIPKDMKGHPLCELYNSEMTIHEDVLYGHFGGPICITDGHYTYFRAPGDNTFNNEYTLMPTDMSVRFSTEDLKSAELSEPFDFTKGDKVLRIKRPTSQIMKGQTYDMLFDICTDPGQTRNIPDFYLRAEYCNRINRLMREYDAPDELYDIYGLVKGKNITGDELIEQEKRRRSFINDKFYSDLNFTLGSGEYIHAVISLLPADSREKFMDKFISSLSGKEKITINDVDSFMMSDDNREYNEMGTMCRFMRGNFRTLDEPQFTSLYGEKPVELI